MGGEPPGTGAPITPPLPRKYLRCTAPGSHSPHYAQAPCLPMAQDASASKCTAPIGLHRAIVSVVSVRGACVHPRVLIVNWATIRRPVPPPPTRHDPHNPHYAHYGPLRACGGPLWGVRVVRVVSVVRVVRVRAARAVKCLHGQHHSRQTSASCMMRARALSGCRRRCNRR